MEEEDKDAFQEEERAGESFLQPSAKSRFATRKVHTCNVIITQNTSTLSLTSILLQVHLEEEEAKARCWG